MRLFERIARGTTKQSKNKDTSLQASIQSEVDGLQQLDHDQAVEVEKLALDIANKERDSSGAIKATAIPAAVAAAAAYVALKPSAANAGITGQLVNQFINQLSPQLSDAFNNMYNAVLPSWFDVTQNASTANTLAVASMADGVNHVKTSTHNQTVLSAAEPDPQQCELDGTCDDEMAAKATESVRSVNTNIALDMSSQAKEGNDRGADIREQIERAEKSESGSGSLIDTAILYSTLGYNSDGEAAIAFDVAKNITGADKQSPSKTQAELLRLAGVSTTADRMDVERATSMARRSIANHVIASQATRRDNRRSGGGFQRSSARINTDEVSRTHTSTATNSASAAGYSDQLNEFVHPAPLMRQYNFQQARTNSLLVQELEDIMTGNVLSGVQLMELLDRRGNT